MNARLLFSLCILGCSGATIERSAPQATTTSSAYATSLEQRLRRQMADAPKSRGAVVIGVWDGDKTMFVSFGDADADTTFEIGSVTKPMTGVLLADEIGRGRLALGDEASAYVPERLPKHDDDGTIRLEHLATFTSGLPYMPTNWVDVDKGTYTPEMWRDFLGSYTLDAAPGTKFAYGNVGFGILGEVLAARENTTLGKLFHERLFEPLHMDHSWLLDERPDGARVAIGHDDSGVPVPLRFDKPIQAGCCAVESTASDLLAFMRAPLSPSTPESLRRAFDLAQTARRRGEDGHHDRDVGLGWLQRRDDGGVYVPNGMMRGYRTGATLDRAHRIATVVLAADAAFPAEVLAMDARQAVLAERDAPKLNVLAALPSDATPASVRWDSGLELVGWSIPKEAAPGETITLRWFYRATEAIHGDFRFFVHLDRHGDRVHGDHAPDRPTSEWPTNVIIEDHVTITIPRDAPPGPLAVYTGLYHFDRMHVTSGSTEDRVRGPDIVVK